MCYAADPIAFAKELHRSAQAYANFRAGKDQHGEANPHLENLQLLGGQGARQHLILLLSGDIFQPTYSIGLPKRSRICFSFTSSLGNRRVPSRGISPAGPKRCVRSLR